MRTRSFQAICLSFVLLASGMGCPTIPAGTAGWPKNTTVTVYVDPGLSGQKDNLKTAFSNWSNKAGTGVTLNVSDSPPPNPQPANSWIVSPTSDPNSGAANINWDAAKITKVTTTYPANVPSSVAVQLMAHEIGHTFYLNDCTDPSCAGATVMEKPTTDSSVTAPSSCDTAAVTANSGGTYSGGGGGGGGCVVQQCVLPVIVQIQLVETVALSTAALILEGTTYAAPTEVPLLLMLVMRDFI